MMTRRILGAALALATTALGANAHADDAMKVRFTTLAPKNSSWGKVFDVWEQAVTKKTSGKLKLEVFYNGVQGMEDSMVAKMKSGQLDGAALTSLGLSRIDKSIGAMTLPWVITSWDKLDKVRPVVAPQFEKSFAAQGFNVLGWGDVGLVYGFSKGFASTKPSDVRGHRPLVWRDEPVGPIVYSLIGQVTPIPLNPTEVLPALQAGSIDMISAPALAAEQLQWVPHLDHVTNEPIVTATGATVFRQATLDKMPADVKGIFLGIQGKVSEVQNKRIRQLDKQAYDRLAKKMTVVKITGKDRDEWEKIARKSLKRLSQGQFDRELMRKVATLAGFKNIDF